MPRVSTGFSAGRTILDAALLSLAIFFLLLIVVSGEGFAGADALVRDLARGGDGALLRPYMEMASFLGGEHGQAVVIGAFSIALWRGRRRWSVSLPIIMAGAGLLQLVAKWAIDRPRPNLDPWGFPSAHVMSLVVLLGCIAYLLGTSELRATWRKTGVALCAAILCTVAYSRMYLDAHWFSDVLGGFSIGFAYLLAVIWWMRGAPELAPTAALDAVLAEPAEVSALAVGAPKLEASVL